MHWKKTRDLEIKTVFSLLCETRQSQQFDQKAAAAECRSSPPDCSRLCARAAAPGHVEIVVAGGGRSGTDNVIGYIRHNSSLASSSDDPVLMHPTVISPVLCCTNHSPAQLHPAGPAP